MTERFSPVNRFAALLAVVAGLLLATAPAPAEPVLAPQDSLVAELVCDILQQGHLNRPEIGDEVSRRLFRAFLDALDPGKLYFLKSDIDEFKKQETELDDMLLKGDLSFPYKVYARFIKRLGERQKLIEELVAAKPDFTVKEYLDTNYKALPYAGTQDELRERWRKRIKFDLLLNRIADKPVGEAEAREKVLKRYQGMLKRMKQMDNVDLLELYLTELTTSIDPHSTYMSAATLNDFEIAMRLNLDGIGALLRSENGETIVVEVVAGGPARVDGRLKPNDKIIAVAQGDDKFVDIVDMRLRDAVKLIRGPRGTKVKIKVIPAGKIAPVVYELTRQKIEIKSQEARGEVIEQGKKPDGKPYLIGVIDLPSFYSEGGDGGKSATEDVRKLLGEFKTKKVDGVALDLRFNGGGALNEALALTGLFIDQGPIVQVKGRDRQPEKLDDPEKGVVYGGPLMVLTSRFSASASEILAGALQDYGRALIVGGSSTHGKGTVQKIIDLSRLRGAPGKLGAVKLTIAQFYRVNGESTQSRGVLSDVVIPSLADSLASAEKDLPNALVFGDVKPTTHEKLDLVPPALKAVLQARSSARIKASAEFARQLKDIDRLNERKASKKVPLNEKELREQMTREEAEKKEGKGEGAEEKESSITGPYKFKRTFMNKEFLHVMEDFVQGKKLVSGK
jgi:carboxyl-terminal processing protease